MKKKIVDYCGICGCPLYSYRHGGICNKKSCQREWESRQKEYEKLFPIYLADLRELANEEGVIFEELFFCADEQEFVHAVLLEE
jgi:hypothetical protein